MTNEEMLKVLEDLKYQFDDRIAESEYSKDEDLFEALESNKMTSEALDMAIKIVKILPKGHRRLIAEPTEEDIEKTIGGKNDFAECIREAVKTVFNNASTIIPADKEREE